MSIIFSLPAISSAGNPVHGAKAIGMGTAFVAVADDPSAIMHNPAGITQVKGTMIYSGNTFIFPTTSYESPSGEKDETEFQVFFPPHLYITSDFGTRDTVFGLGVYSPFGIGGRKWPDDGLTRFMSVESYIATISVNPTVAWQIHPDISIAAGIDYMWSFNKSKRMMDQSALQAGDGRMELDSKGDGWGYNLGVLISLHKKLSLGFAYRSRIRVDQSGDITLSKIAPPLRPLFGGSRFVTEAETTLDFPDTVSLGIAYRPTEKLTLAFDAEWVGWSSFDTMKLKLKEEVPEAAFTDSSTALKWHDVWTFKVGADYKATDRFSIRCGYAYIENPVPNETLEPGNPDSNQHNISIGFGYKIKKWVFDFFYNADFYEDRKVSNRILSGEYENFVHVTGFSIGYRF